MVFLFQSLKNFSTNKYDPARLQLQLERTAYRPTIREFQKEVMELTKYLDAFNRVKDLDTSIWTLHAAPESVFGTLISQLAEIFNILLKSMSI